MQPRISGLLGVMAALAVAALGCKKDPLADGAGTPTAIQTEFDTLKVKIGALTPTTFQAWVVDARSTRVEATITFSACDATKATVVADASYDPVPPTSARAAVTGVAAGTTCATVTSGSLKPDTVAIDVS